MVFIFDVIDPPASAERWRRYSDPVRHTVISALIRAKIRHIDVNVIHQFDFSHLTYGGDVKATSRVIGPLCVT